jgi:flotillin
MEWIFLVAALLVVMILLVLVRSIIHAYVKTPANRAFVRTGGFSGKANNPPKVVMNGGAWVFKSIHEITWVDLGTMAIEIERTEQNALLTIDPQYADIKAIFYIKVNPTVEGIVDAARTIGGKQVDANAVKALVDAKLDGALRDVAASFSLMSLHQEREKFIQEVQNRLKTDLEENGLMLEAVSILTLRAARQGTFGTDDVFGAQVARANAQVIQQALRERNEIERTAEIEIKIRDTEASKQRLELDRQLALATVTQEREVRSNQAVERAQAAQKEFEEKQKEELARISKERAVALSELERDQELAIQGERKTQEVAKTNVLRQQTIELAEQQRQITVLQEQQKREAAEKDRLLVSAEREQANQALKTIEATQQAQREAQIQVIQAEREAKKVVIEQQNKIELDAMRKQREAEAQARALKETASAQAEAATKQAETLRTQAQAEMEAEKLHAEGAKARSSATGLAEADVMKAKAEANMREAEAIRARGLAEADSQKAQAEALAAFDGVAQRVELVKLELDAKVRIEIARADAFGKAVASMDLKLIGDPNAAASLLRLVTLSDGLGEVIKAAPQSVQDLGRGLMSRVTGPLPPEPHDGDGTNNHTNGMADLAQSLPALVKLVETTLKMDELNGKSVKEVLAQLASTVKPADKALVEKAQAALAAMPLINDLPFEELYLRVTTKA